jgi:imidazolonepropionase-like amidohydrolase
LRQAHAWDIKVAALRRLSLLREEGMPTIPSLLLTILLATPAPPAAAAERVALRCGRLIDMESAGARGPTTVLIEGERIQAIGADLSLPEGTREVDLGEFTCLPGMIDLHAHLLIDPEILRGSALSRSSAERSLTGLKNARTMLHSGFTTLRSPGEFDLYFASVAVRDALARGDFEGPDLFVAPHGIGPTGGHSDFNDMEPEYGAALPTRVADGPDALRRAIREEVRNGADWIKLMATGGVMSAGDNPRLTAYTDEEMRAAVDETHRHGKKITVHAIGTEGIKSAVRAGVDCVEHGILIDEEGIALMKERGTWLVPTLFVLNYVIDEGPRLGYREESVNKGRALREERDRRIRRAFAAGVKVAFGSDTIFPHHLAAKEFAEMVRLGMTPAQAMQAATLSAAEVLGLRDVTGSLAVGKRADIIAVPGDPLQKVERLEDVRFVMKRGRIVKRPGA